MYSFCKAFSCSPREYNNTLAEDVDVMLEIHKELKTLEIEDQKRLAAQNRL